MATIYSVYNFKMTENLKNSLEEEFLHINMTKEEVEIVIILYKRITKKEYEFNTKINKKLLSKIINKLKLYMLFPEYNNRYDDKNKILIDDIIIRKLTLIKKLYHNIYILKKETIYGKKSEFILEDEWATIFKD